VDRLIKVFNHRSAAAAEQVLAGRLSPYNTGKDLVFLPGQGWCEGLQKLNHTAVVDCRLICPAQVGVMARRV
jgi:hypothetical protein